MKTILFTGVLSLCSMLALAQLKGPSISFDSNSHNYGDIKEESGIANHRFEFTNVGSEPLVINKVEPSCGCTSSDYTKSPVAPGAKGYVTAGYNPSGRPGAFNKSISVTSNGEPGLVVLRISGNVVPKPKTIADDYPFDMGSIRLKKNHVPFAKIMNTMVKTDSLEVVNVSTELVKITFAQVPAHLSFTTVPEVLKPDGKGYIYVTYNAKTKNDFGFFIENVNLLTNGEMAPKAKISVSAEIMEDFSALSEKERKNAPVAFFENKIFDFKTIKQGESVNYEYKLENKGKSDLIIRKTKASCGCTAIEPAQKVIKPGESTVIKTIFNSTGKKGVQNKTITIITNDPVNPSIELKVTGTVDAPPSEKDNAPLK